MEKNLEKKFDEWKRKQPKEFIMRLVGESEKASGVKGLKDKFTKKSIDSRKPNLKELVPKTVEIKSNDPDKLITTVGTVRIVSINPDKLKNNKTKCSSVGPRPKHGQRCPKCGHML